MRRTWVESMAARLPSFPVSAPTAWGGCTEAGMIVGGTDTPDDWDRACAVEEPAEAVAIGRRRIVHSGNH